MISALIVADKSIEYALDAWLHSKATRSGSEKTRRAYQDTIERFRHALQTVGLDLDSDLARVADVAQVWASRSWKAGEEVSAGTFNQRLAILSSFYSFAHKRRILVGENPMDIVERRTVQVYNSARALEPSEIAESLAAIDRSTLDGKRDWAFLSTALLTGRRLSELLNVRWGDIEWHNGVATVTWRRTKGGRSARDSLPLSISAVIRDWVDAMHKSPSGDTYIWTSLSNNSFGRRLSASGAAKIVDRHLGTTKVHATRHSFSAMMLQSGAPVTAIQERLGHSNLATTDRYLRTLKRADNQYGSALESLLGINKGDL